MSAIVFEELQSCLDSQFPEQRALRLRISPSKPPPPSSGFLEFGGPDPVPDRGEEKREEAPRIPPSPDSGLSGCFSRGGARDRAPPLLSHCLSSKSLELCTENLGSETGCDMIKEDDCFLPSSPRLGDSSPAPGKPERRENSGAGKQSGRGQSFPPPLTTMRGSEPLRIQPHREGGRVVMRAVAAPAAHPYLQAERSHGRLRLFFPKNEIPDETEEKQKHEEEEEEEAEEEAFEEDMDGITFEFGDKMGTEKFRRPGRCKGEHAGNRHLLNWESHWVATS